MPSEEYLKAMLTQTKEYLPKWLFNELHKAARAQAGGMARWRSPVPTFFEKLALEDIRPGKLRDAPDSEIKQAWLRLHQWFINAKRKKQPIEDFVNAAVFVIQEMRRRKLKFSEDTSLAKKALELERVGKRFQLGQDFQRLPEFITVVRQFISAVGSEVKANKKNPEDRDVLIRADMDEKGNFLIQSENIWLPLRNVLDPDKKDILQFSHNAQGPHDDHAALYSLCLRRERQFDVEVVKGFPNEVPEAGVHVHNLERENKKTKKDGAHRHLFTFPDGDQLWTEEDGEHEHPLKSSTENEAQSNTGEHRHKLILQDGTEVFTETGGKHDHQLQVWSSAFDGIHTHKLKLGDGTVIETPLPGEYWVMHGKPSQKGTPKAPPSTQLARLAKQEIGPEVPPKGPVGAMVMFVGDSPSKVDGEEKKPFADRTGEILESKYLKPLGLKRDDVSLSNIVPKVLFDASGKMREPTKQEIDEHKEKFFEDVIRLNPKIIVALGEIATEVLDTRADLSLPHPNFVEQFGPPKDFGEMIERLKRLIETQKRIVKSEYPVLEISQDRLIVIAAMGYKLVQKQRAPGEEGSEEIRTNVAERQFRENWHEFLPSSGKGRFVYQHHWRGLEKTEGKDETRLGDSELLNSTNSLHGDLRMEGEDGLWGWAILIGQASDNKKAGGDKLIAIKPDQKLRIAIKLPQPKPWLQVGVKKPLVTKPGEVGSTAQAFAKFFALDKGQYQMGFGKRNFFEVFLDGEKLKGRYVLQGIPVEGGKRVWNISRPEDQTPFVDREDLVEQFKDQKRKGRKFIYIAKPGFNPILVDLKRTTLQQMEEIQRRVKPENEKIKKSFGGQHELQKIVKIDKEKQIVYEIIHQADGPPDSQGDIFTEDELRQAAHYFLINSREIWLKHTEPANVDFVESVVLLKGDKFHGIEMEYISWIGGFHIKSKKLWQKIKNGEFNTISMGGFGLRERIK